jgi:cysteine synthase A
MDTATSTTTHSAEFRGRVYDSIIDTIGATPLVRVHRLARNAGAKAYILAKCEFFNPFDSVKDRIGVSMIAAAEGRRPHQAWTVLVEPTSGNTGIALAFVRAAKGYRLILTMPESMSVERRKMLLARRRASADPGRARDARRYRQAEEIVGSLPDAFIPQQFQNPANPEIHRRTTAEEIWKDTGGAVDVVVSGVGTGGTLTGVGSVLKPRKPGLKMIAVEPEDSAVLSGGPPGSHRIQGIGAGFIPDILDTSLIDEIIRIGNDTAISCAREAARLEGLAVGISSGAALAASRNRARPELAGKTVVVVLPDFAERYLSTALFDGL